MVEEMNFSDDEDKKNFISYLSNEFIPFLIDRGADARELVGAQRSRWTTLIETAFRNFDSNYPDDGLKIKATFDFMISTISQREGGLFRTSNMKNEVRAVGRIPMLSAGHIDLSNISEIYVVAAIIAEALAPIKILYAKGDPILDSISDEIPTIVVVEISNYLIDKKRFNNRCFYESQSTYEKTRVLIQDTAANINESKENIARYEVSLKNEINVYKSEFLEVLTNQKETFDDFVKNSTEKIEAARASAREGAAVDGATRVWSEKYKRHNITFAIISTLLVIFVIFLSVILILYFKEIKNGIPTKSDGDIAYGYILIFLVPIIAVAWIVRIFTRWAVSSLALSEDAGQRKAMIETYLRLVADPNASMAQADRIIILNALFRPLPGSAQEDISPPTVADFLKEAFAAKGK